MIDKVSAENFYKDDGDKIKINWFLYEYSNILFSKITESPKLAHYRKRHNEENISAFCVYFSKRLRQGIINAHTGKTKGVIINARYIYEFYQDNSYDQTQQLLEATGDAWSEHILVCDVCPNQCLNDGFEITDMFDNLKNTGWPTVHKE
jgi:hypothetical protein